MTTDEIVETIRAALASDATPEARARAADTCRAILGVLAPQSVATPTQPAVAPQHPNVAALASAVRGMPPDQLLDLVIARLRAALPAGMDVPNATPIRFQLVSPPAPTKRGTP
jgi:hypothetical protein